MVLQDLDVISFAYSPSSSMIVRLLIAPQTTPRFHTNLTIGPDPNKVGGGVMRRLAVRIIAYSH